MYNDVALRVLYSVNKAIAEGVGCELPASWRIMYYLPLEHAENLADQNLCVAMYELLLAVTPTSRQAEVKLAWTGPGVTETLWPASVAFRIATRCCSARPAQRKLPGLLILRHLFFYLNDKCFNFPS